MCFKVSTSRDKTANNTGSCLTLCSSCAEKRLYLFIHHHQIILALICLNILVWIYNKISYTSADIIIRDGNGNGGFLPLGWAVAKQA